MARGVRVGRGKGVCEGGRGKCACAPSSATSAAAHADAGVAAASGQLHVRDVLVRVGEFTVHTDIDAARQLQRAGLNEVVLTVRRAGRETLAADIDTEVRSHFSATSYPRGRPAPSFAHP